MASNSNRKIGNAFEQEFCELLSEHGFWVHNLAQNKAGQPADVIAARHGVSYLIDCKVCSRGVFDFSRIEENQKMAMSLWENCRNGDGWFALKFPTEHIYMVSTSQIMFSMLDGRKTMDENWAIRYCHRIDRWVNLCK